MQTGSRSFSAARGRTQEELAHAVGVSRQHNSIERNRYVPSLELALIFARVFACPTDEIFHIEELQQAMQIVAGPGAARLN